MRTRVGILLSAVALVGLACGATFAQEASITLDPTSGPARTEVMAAGTGFTETSCGVDLYLDAIDGTMLAKAQLDQGAFSATFVVPNDATVGEHIVIAVGLDLDGDDCSMPSGQEASAPFTVEEPLPTVTLDPASGPPTSIFFARGEFFDVDSCGVDLYLDSASGMLLGSAPVSAGEFLREIQRRRVGSVAIGYAVVAFVVLQVAELVVPGLPVPESTYSVVVAAVLAGFPLALVFSWLYDITARGVERTQSDSPRSQRKGLIALQITAVVVSLLIAGGLGWWILGS